MRKTATKILEKSEGYDTRDNFNYLDERKIDPGIRVRRNAKSPSRRRAVIEQEK